MKNVKKMFVLAATVITLGIMLTACSSKEDKVTLTVWGDADNQAVLENAFEKINEEFMKQNENIVIDYQWTGTIESINVALQSDTLPDLFWVQGNKSTQMAEMARNGYILSLAEYDLDYSRFPEDALVYGTVDDEIYCSLPSFVAYVTMYYNKDIFEQYSLEVPNTWGEFESLVADLKENGETPIALGGNGDFDRYWFIQAMAASLADDVLTDIVNNEEQIDFKNLETVFESYKTFAENGYFGEDAASIDGTGAQLSFTNGRSAMIADGTWNNEVYEDMAINVGRFALPGFDGTSYAQSGPSNFNTYAVSAKTKYPDEAVKYIEFLNSKEAQQILADEVGLVPMIDDITIKGESVQEMADFDDIGLNIYNSLSQVADEKSKPQDLLLTSLLPDLLMGKISGIEAITLLQEELDKAE